MATDTKGAKGAAFVDVTVATPNDGCGNAIALALVPDVPTVFRTSSATTQTVDPSDPATCSDPAIAHSMWFSFTAPANGTVDIDTAGSTGDTIAAVYQGTCSSLGTALDCNDDATGVSGGYSKLRTISVTSGTTYRLLVASWASGSFQPAIESLIARVLFKPATAAPAGTTAVLPVLLDAFGRGGARYVSDLALLNRSQAPLTLALTYGGGVSGADRTSSLTLGPGEQLRASDALGELRREGLLIPPTTSTASQVGSLTALVTNGGANGLLLASRTASPNPNAAVGGSFGLFSQGTSYADAADAGPVYVYGLRQTERDRANVAFMHVRTPGVTDAITLEVEIFTAAGASAGTQSVTLAPTEWKQLNEILSGAGAGATTADGGYVRVRRTAGNGRFIVYGVVNDQKTADGSLVPMAKAGELTAGSSVLVPIVLQAGGLGGSFYTSELVLANRSTKSGTAVLRYVGAPLFGGAGTGSVRVPLAAGSQKVIDGVLAYLRNGGLEIPTAGAQGGALFVTFEGFDSTDDVYAGVRTGTPNPDAAQGGAFGVFSAGVPSSALATTSALVPGLRLDSTARTNVAAVNAGDSPITLEIQLRAGAGQIAGNKLTRTLAPGEWYQWSNVFDLAGAGAGEGYAVITRTSGSSSWFAYGVLNDSATSDGSVVSMVR
ncbi:MAG: PPC domain-containing protein [Acidobacteria bacterium]|nr:PPC domain-containing protein [Acidobacteriota bacterium]